VRSLSSCGLNFKIAIAWDRNAGGDHFGNKQFLGNGDRFWGRGKSDRISPRLERRLPRMVSQP